MKLKVLVMALLLAAGVTASVALAKGPPAGKGHGGDDGAAATAPTGTDQKQKGKGQEKQADKKVTVCHRTGNGSFRKIKISKKALPAHMAHGDSVATEGAPCSAGTGTTATPTTTGP